MILFSFSSINYDSEVTLHSALYTSQATPNPTSQPNNHTQPAIARQLFPNRQYSQLLQQPLTLNLLATDSAHLFFLYVTKTIVPYSMYLANFHNRMRWTHWQKFRTHAHSWWLSAQISTALYTIRQLQSPHLEGNTFSVVKYFSGALPSQTLL